MKLTALRGGFVLIGCTLAFLLGGCDLIGKQKTYASPQEADRCSGRGSQV